MTEENTLMETRETLYRLLGRLYLTEVDEALLAQLKAMQFPEDTGAAELDEGYKLLRGYLANPGDNAIEDLAVDYARMLLGAGIYEKDPVAYPYESVFTSKKRLIMQEAWEDVVRIYSAHGFVKRDKNIPEDHLGLELEFMAELIAEGRKAEAAGNKEAFGASLAAQKSFLETHLLNWLPKFRDEMMKCPGTDFYKGVAKVTAGFAALDQALLSEEA